MNHATSFIAVAAALVLGACAAPAQKVAAPATQSAAPAAQTAAAKNISVQEATAGYRRVVVDGREMYCRPDEVLGSRVSRGEVCRTAAELENMRRNSEEFMRGVANTGASGVQGGNQANAPR